MQAKRQSKRCLTLVSHLRMQGGPPEVIASVLVDRISSAGVRSIACDERLVFLAASDQRVNVFHRCNC